ncbi:hypothetical protein [Altererythrobacter sp. Root672]|uniref:hypothetical protein n=1 Tax=Altererythrobacter sp. Root672 TaxID=1736584 RepID=UPI0006FA6BB4|nr:hypothetical protein [Altererythrobacter sp. Root672]KRA84421.1 hypothetical protein ASD76_10725 [Altererythrobacter sp. Root672]
MRVGFLFNHAAGHQVGHAIPIASALARLYPGVELQLFVSGGAAEAEVRRAWAADGHSFDDRRIEQLSPPSNPTRFLASLSGGALPVDRISILRRNTDRFRGLDALVAPEKTSTLLKSRFGLEQVALIHTRHGAGDRAVGFDAASGRFDLVLLSGAKIKDRLEQAGLLKPDGYAIVGYPKFDLCGDAAPAARLFDNDRPTVLYNPHPSPALSSWYRMGTDVLDWFAGQDRFNLIFAPHVMLFAKRWTIGLSPLSIARVPQVPEHYLGLPHIHVDLGSSASLDMTYTNAADIYLGDASSQVYEFIRRPRPCIFLNPRELNWQGSADFAHWQAGPVVSSVNAMAHALDQALAYPNEYTDMQKRLFAYSFDLNERPSADRAADAIVTWLDRCAAGEQA